jgi:FlaA1/EpsC-like NDP-sugar epimerase
MGFQLSIQLVSPLRRHAVGAKNPAKIQKVLATLLPQTLATHRALCSDAARAEQFGAFLLVALAVQLTANHLFGLYGRMWRHAGIEEARQILLSSALTLVVLVALYPLGRATGFAGVPLGVVIIGSVFCSLAMGALRFHSRLFAWQRGSRRQGLRVAVIGSRDAGAAVVRDMLRNPKAGLMPVAVFDDDAGAHGLSLLGVPVVGGVDDIEAAASRYDIQQVVLAIPSPTAELSSGPCGPPKRPA